jgi:hypothetical protein
MMFSSGFLLTGGSLERAIMPGSGAVSRRQLEQTKTVPESRRHITRGKIDR